jgi:site-specific DNA-methyltransferase (adenine-specific)
VGRRAVLSRAQRIAEVQAEVLPTLDALDAERDPAAFILSRVEPATAWLREASDASLVSEARATAAAIVSYAKARRLSLEAIGAAQTIVAEAAMREGDLTPKRKTDPRGASELMATRLEVAPPYERSRLRLLSAQRDAVRSALADLAPRGEATMTALVRAAREHQAKERYQERRATWDAQANSAGEAWEVRLGDFRDALADVAPGSVDAIVTDPPYADEYLPLWGDLAAFAAEKLRPGAPLFAWSGQYRLPEVLAHLTGWLRYQWTLCLLLPGANSRFRTTNMLQGYKPIVVCTAGAWGPHDWYSDVVVSPSQDQDLFEWQQNWDPAAELMARYVPEGGLVVDPFAGVGSFGVAALSAGRRFLGAELDEGRHMEACQRLLSVTASGRGPEAPATTRNAEGQP